MTKREVKEIFAKRLKFYRKMKNFTQEQLAELAETTAQTISGIENRYNFPSTTLMDKIIDRLGVKAYEMFLDEGENINIDNIELQAILVQKFKCLDDEKQKMMLTIIESLVQFKGTV